MAVSVAPRCSHNDPSRIQLHNRATISAGPLIQKRSALPGANCQNANRAPITTSRAAMRPGTVATNRVIGCDGLGDRHHDLAHTSVPITTSSFRTSQNSSCRWANSGVNLILNTSLGRGRSMLRTF